ncbi:MAG TPA: DUF167 domain-containing protein [bacterium]|nr:DUF167 domain-containing protein [bacterium]
MAEALESVGFLRENGKGCTLSIKVVPKCPRDQVIGEENGELKVRLKAPPVDGLANEALIAFLAVQLKVPRRSLELVSGRSSRHKVVQVLKAKASDVRGVLIQ